MKEEDAGEEHLSCPLKRTTCAESMFSCLRCSHKRGTVLHSIAKYRTFFFCR